MNSVHPSETAGDGKTIEQSRFIQKSDKPDRRIQCAQCGFPVDLDTRATGDSLGAIADPALSTETVTPPAPGVAETEYYGTPADTNSGCPFCNSMSPQATARGKTGFDRVGPDLSNL